MANGPTGDRIGIALVCREHRASKVSRKNRVLRQCSGECFRRPATSCRAIALATLGSTNDLMRDAELELASQAETSYKRMVQDQQAGAPAKTVGASVTVERA